MRVATAIDLPMKNTHAIPKGNPEKWFGDNRVLFGLLRFFDCAS